MTMQEATAQCLQKSYQSKEKTIEIQGHPNCQAQGPLQSREKLEQEERSVCNFLLRILISKVLLIIASAFSLRRRQL